MQNITQQRAAIGGEIGANGEFYEGGKFIATKDNAKATPKVKAAKCRKVQIAPYQWAMEPTPTARAIFSFVGWSLIMSAFDYDSKVCELAVHMPFINAAMNNVTPEQLAFYRELCERFNRGERWV